MCLLCIEDKDKTKVTLDDLKRIPYVKWCIMEGIRLRAPGAITRKVVRPLKLQVSHNRLFSVQSIFFSVVSLGFMQNKYYSST